MRLYLSFIVIILLSCNSSSNNEAASVEDSLGGRTEEEIRDSLKKIPSDVFFDTVGVASAPVKVLSATITRDGSARKIEVFYKNISDKKVSGIRFGWFGRNAFGDLAEMGGLTNGFGGGEDDRDLNAGQSRKSLFLISSDAKKILVWPTEVVFEDGTTWKSKRKE